MKIIKNNVEDIKNPSEVNCIYVYKNQNKRCLMANLVMGITVQLTQVEDISTFPQNALNEYLKQVGISQNYLKDFYVANLHSIPLNTCINKKHLLDFEYENNSKGIIDIYANFKNVISVRVFSVKEYTFEQFKECTIDKILSLKQKEKEV